MVLRLRHTVGQRGETRRRQHRTRDIEAPPFACAVAGQPPSAQHHVQDTDGHVDQQSPAPGQEIKEQSAHEVARRSARQSEPLRGSHPNAHPAAARQGHADEARRGDHRLVLPNAPRVPDTAADDSSSNTTRARTTRPRTTVRRSADRTNTNRWRWRSSARATGASAEH